jgi:mRNA interferase RelE/StbE
MITRFRDKFGKDIDKISDRNVLDDIADVIVNVEKATKPSEIKNLKKFKGDKTAFRIRIGNYRIGIFIIKNEVEFTRVLPKNKIYEYFPD